VHYFASYGELALEEAMDLSLDRPRNEWCCIPRDLNSQQ